MTKRAARAALPPALLGASHAPGRAPDHGFWHRRFVQAGARRWLLKPGPGTRRRAWEASSSAGRAAARAQRVLRCL